MSGKQAENAIEFLASIASIIELIATNLDANRLDRRAIRKLLHEYSSRAEADGRLINASRQDPRCVDHGLFLAYVHMEFLSSLAKFNFTIPATSTKWYSWRTLLKKYRLSLFSISSQTAELQKQFGNIKEKAQLLSTDLQTNNITIPSYPVEYGDVSPTASTGSQLPAYHDLLQRGSIARQQLIGSLAY